MFNTVKDMNLKECITLIEGTIEQFFNDRTYSRYVIENTVNSVLSGNYISFKDFLNQNKYVSDLDKQELEFKHKQEAKKVREKRDEIFKKLLQEGGE
ncbi:MAG: hypothetical protein KIB43_07945 [Clostridium baratii]|uniref:hypothetical protein n=1 Tax=Clostridium baratii TaxID=1561 RepID=UPI00242B9963|nr:hypothetical protein [Clostridium baratii]MBS6006880.1 hypothetical protein [Clostridium baratii]